MLAYRAGVAALLKYYLFIFRIFHPICQGGNKYTPPVTERWADLQER